MEELTNREGMCEARIKVTERDSNLRQGVHNASFGFHKHAKTPDRSFRRFDGTRRVHELRNP